MPQALKIGAIGGPGGSSFDDSFIGDLPLMAIGIHAGSYIDALVLTYGNANENETVIHGGGGGQANNTFTLNSGEFITSIVGRAGDYIDQLQFITNQARSYGPFGGTGGNNFIIELPPNWRLVKFWGMSGSYLDALGIYLQPT
jgi:hypothetical protein